MNQITQSSLPAVLGLTRNRRHKVISDCDIIKMSDTVAL